MIYDIRFEIGVFRHALRPCPFESSKKFKKSSFEVLITCFFAKQVVTIATSKNEGGHKLDFLTFWTLLELNRIWDRVSFQLFGTVRREPRFDMQVVYLSP